MCCCYSEMEHSGVKSRLEVGPTVAISVELASSQLEPELIRVCFK